MNDFKTTRRSPARSAKRLAEFAAHADPARFQAVGERLQILQSRIAERGRNRRATKIASR